MKYRVHYQYPLNEADFELLIGLLDPVVDLTMGQTPPPDPYQMLVAGRPSEELITASPILEKLVIPWAGLPEVTRELMQSYPEIAIHNLHHNAVITAETGMALLLAAAKRVVTYDRELRQGDWRPRYEDTHAVLLHRKTVLILGFGQIGQHLGQICAGFGMRVLATKRNPAVKVSYPAEVFPPDELFNLLPQADFLAVTLPHTPETDGLLDKQALALLPRHAVLVNIGRAAIIDQAALYTALKEGQIHAAGLDVWYNYPTDEASRANTAPADYPFHELDNLVMSPHRGGHVVETQQYRFEHLAKLINQAARGEDLPNRVDLAAGY